MPGDLLTPEESKALGLPELGITAEGAGELGLPPALPTSTAFSEPEPLARDEVDPVTRKNISIFEQHMSLSSSAPEEANKVLQISRDMGLAPESVAQDPVAMEYIRKREQVEYKISQLPRLREYMLRSPYHATAIADEVEKWGTLEKIFGRYEYDAGAMQRWSENLAAGRAAYEDRPKSDTYSPPGWALALGRAGYSLTTSAQSLMAMAWAPGGAKVEDVKQRRDISDQPVPGDSDFVSINGVVGMAPLITAGIVHPAAAFGLMYVEATGRTYEDLRLAGYDHTQAGYVANAVGLSSATIAAAMGPMFKSAQIPLAVKGSLVGLSNPFVLSLTQRPAAWRALLGLGKNFFWNTAMNVSMATAEVGIREGFDASREGRPYSYSRVASDAARATNAWAEMMALSVLPAYEEHARRAALYPLGQEVKALDARAKMAEQVRQNYEERGRALRSIHDAMQIVTAVDAIHDSKFMRDNPEEARDLIQSMVSPRASQTVYVKPEALQKMGADQLAGLRVGDTSLGAAGNVPVGLVDLLLHPDSQEIVPNVAGGPDLLTLREATGVDLTRPAVTGADVSDERLDQYLADERARNGAGRGPRIPTQQEILSGVQQAQRAAGSRRPPPDLGPDVHRDPVTPETPHGREALDRWAEDAVSRRPTSELKGMVEQHEALRDEHSRQAMLAQEAATAHAEAGRSPDEAKRISEERQHRANVSAALHRAARDAVAEVDEVGGQLAAMSSEDPPPGAQTRREAAWAADPVFGAAHDAIMENLGLARVRNYAAPDLSDAYDKMARDQTLANDFDLTALNKLLRQRNDVAGLSLQELREVMRALNSIQGAVDEENTIRYNGLRVAKGIVLDEARNHLKLIKDRPPGQRMYGDADLNQQRAGKTAAGLAAMVNQPHTLMFKLGKVGDWLYFESFVPGVMRENTLWGGLLPELKRIYDAFPADIRKSGDDEVPEISYDNQELQRTEHSPVRWGIRKRSDVWHMALHLGVEGADVKIARGLGVSPAALHDWVQKNLGRTPDEAHAVMQGLVAPHWKLFDGLWSEYERYFRERGIAPPEKLRAQKLTIHGREYDGGYGGRLQWLDPTNNKPILHPGSLERLLEWGASGPETPRPHLDERDPSFQGMALLNWAGVAESMKKEIHDIALRGFVEDAHKIFSDGEIRGLVGDKLGREAMKQIYDPSGEGSWLHVVARGTVADVAGADWFTRGAMRLQGLAAYSAFSLNAKVMLGQFSHLVAAVPGMAINPMHMSVGTTAAFNPERRAWAHTQSQVLPLRWQEYQSRAEELNRQMTGVGPNKRGGVREATDELNWAAWREMDGFLSHALWEAAYAKFTMRYQISSAEQMSHEQAVREADRVVVMMMPAQDVYDQSAFVRDRRLAGFSFLVRNFPNTLLNVGIMNMWNERVGGTGGWGQTRMAAQYVGMVMAAEILGKGYLMHLGPREGEDEDEWLKERAIEALFYPTMTGPLALGAYHAARGEPRRAVREVGRMMPPSVGVLAQGIGDVGNILSDGDTEHAYRSAAHLLGLSVRSPLPGKLYDISNAARNSESTTEVVKKGMGYR